MPKRLFLWHFVKNWPPKKCRFGIFYDSGDDRVKTRKKEGAKYAALTRKYDDIINLELEDDQLSGNQLKGLLHFKKQRTDKGFSSFKKKELLQLWKEWKPRLDEPTEYVNTMVHSISGATVGTTVDAKVISPDDNTDEQSKIDVQSVWDIGKYS